MITPALLRLFALAAGVAVGNITIAQPLLDELAGALLDQLGRRRRDHHRHPGRLRPRPRAPRAARRHGRPPTSRRHADAAFGGGAGGHRHRPVDAGPPCRDGRARFPRGDDAGARRLRRLARRSPRSRAGDRDRHERGRARHPRGADPGRRHERCVGMAGGLPCRRGPHVARRMAAAARSPDGPPNRVLGSVPAARHLDGVARP